MLYWEIICNAKTNRVVKIPLFWGNYIIFIKQLNVCMDKETLINFILLEWASRSPNGLCSNDYSESDLECLYEIVKETNLSVDEAVDFVNDVSVLTEKGKHPERQAYNKNGILVTFPTPEYKARALAKGTHFEKDPRAAQSNLFGGGQQAPSAATPSTAPAVPPTGAPAMDAGDTALPPSDSGQPQTPPAQKEIPEPGTPGGEVPPAPVGGTVGGSVAGTTATPAQGQLATEPTTQAVAPSNVASPPATPTPPPVQKTPQEIAAEKEVIKQMLNTDDTTPTIPGVGGAGITENLKKQLTKLTKIALEMNLNEAVKFISKHL